MYDSSAPSGGNARSTWLSRIVPRGGWQLLRQRRAIVILFISLDLLALVVSVGSWWLAPATDWIAFAVLTVTAVVQAEASRRIEQLRRALTDTPHVNMTSVWTFAAVVVLPLGLALASVGLIYAHLWWRVWHNLHARPAYRVICSWAVIVMSAAATAAVLHLVHTDLTSLSRGAGVPAAAALIAGILTFSTVNSLFVALTSWLFTRKHTWLALWGTLGDNALEFGTLGVGGLVAVAVHTAPALVVLVLPPVLVLHRAVLVRQLEVQAATDSKTGLLNAAAWMQTAEKEQTRAARTGTTFGILMVDLDHFKQVNDTHGHLAGDDVLRAVATVLRTETRDYDHAGRFGGEEFVALIPDADPIQVMAVADRIRLRITELAVTADDGAGERIAIDNLSASVGAAMCPLHGTTIHTLLRVADTHLYTAKHNGRNQVVGLDTTAVTRLPVPREQTG